MANQTVPNDDTLSDKTVPSLWLALILPAMAGGMGWGIRGQYGHETGAMIAGLLVALTLVLLFCPKITSLNAARAVALAALGVSFGGAMTYGQTLGLTQNSPVIGNYDAMWWGFLGVAIKGGAWIGIFGAFLGMGLGGKQYRPLDLAILFLTLVFLLFVGIWICNQPFDPLKRLLPEIYFSADWYWEPDNAALEPRFENWGGFLFAWIGLVAHLGWIKRDDLARNLAIAGLLGGALGFPAGQALQAFHAWNRDAFASSAFAGIDQYMNWWNMMEITFGAIMGAALGLGLWLNRQRIADNDVDGPIELTRGTEWLLITMHAVMIAAWNFMSFKTLDGYADLALTMGIIPAIGIVGGRLWPWMLAFPLLALPIAGKTLEQMAYKPDQVSAAHQFSATAGWIFLFAMPLIVMLAAAAYFIARAKRGQTGRAMVRRGLLLATWFYFTLNFVFFESPWPWREPTGRTPSAAIFVVCAVGLTIAALTFGRGTVNFRSEGERNA